MAGWRERNRQYDRQRWADYYAANTDRLNQAARRWYQENRAEVLANAARYREQHRDLIRQRKAEGRRNDPNWPLKNRENSRVRRSRRGQRVDYLAILAEHGMVCHLCGGEIPSLADLHMDHVVPLARGGAHTADNIRPAHAACNTRKGARTA